MAGFFSKFMRDDERLARRTSLHAIVENLNNILNTKRDYGSPLRELGIRPLTEYISREDIAIAVMKEVRENIERYEPRIRLDTIALEKTDNPFVLSFKVKCTVLDHPELLQMQFETTFGRFSVNNG